jgi:hypothetical protein
MPNDLSEEAVLREMDAEYKRGAEDALKRVKELMGRAPYASAWLNNIADEFGVKL